jgi:hypothetical protein
MKLFSWLPGYPAQKSHCVVKVHALRQYLNSRGPNSVWGRRRKSRVQGSLSLLSFPILARNQEVIRG